MRAPAHLRMRQALCAATALLSLATFAAPAMPADDAFPPLRPGETLRDTWQPGKRLSYTLTLAAGDLVQGRLDGPAATLDLANAEGRHVRRLLAANTLSRSFLFVAPADGRFSLTIDGTAAGLAGTTQTGAPAAFSLTVDRIVPRASQHVPAVEPESPAIRALARTLRDGGDTRAFWQAVAARGTPLIESVPPAADASPSPAGTAPTEPTVRVTFLWRGAAHGVRLLGSPAGDHDPLERLADSDVWYRTYRVPASTRLSYQLAPDVPALNAPAPERRRAILATAQRDPLNPHAFALSPSDAGLDVFQQKSVLELPAAPPQPWIARRAGVPSGTLAHHRIASHLLGEARDIYLYRPAPGHTGQSGKPQDLALLVLFDAHAYLSAVPTPVILDNLIHDGLLPPVAALIVANPSAQARAGQLPPNPAFADFLADELMPWAAARGLAASAARTVVAGSSYGGIAAAYAGLRHPERFGLVLSQSGSFWWAPAASPDAPPREGGWLMREYSASPRLPLRFYLEAGRFEDGRGAVNILTTTRHMRDVLRAKGYPLRHAEFASGHDYLQWRGTLACGLMALIGTARAQAAIAPGGSLAGTCPMSAATSAAESARD